MIKNIGILVLGLLVGAFLMNVYSGIQVKDMDSNFQSKEPINTKLESNSNLNASNTVSDSSKTKILLEEIDSLKAELSIANSPELNSQNKVIRNGLEYTESDLKEMTDEAFSKVIFDLYKKRDKLSEEEEKFGSIALEALKRNQPIELKNLFGVGSKLPDGSLKRREDTYKKHLAQEKDINWAYQAEGFLRNYFGSLRDSDFLALRIDCRSSTCEVAGIFNFEGVVDEMSIEQLAKSDRLESYIRVRNEIQQLPLFTTYFKTSMSRISFNANTFILNPMPHMFFFHRAK